MSWQRIAMYVVFNGVLSLLASLVFGGRFGTVFVSSIMISAGYVYGSFMAAKAMRTINDEELKTDNDK